MAENQITVTSTTRNWILGNIEGMSFAAKVCDIPSEYGINNGRVIKLSMSIAGRDYESVIWERGWGRYPRSSRHEDIMYKLIAWLETLPPADRWDFPAAKAN